jgi:tetratricopeptide (TPR) repeat protein
MRRVGLLLVLCLCLGFVQQACTAPDKPASSLQQARSAFAEGYFLEAEKAFETYLKDNPKGKDRLEAWTRLVEIAVDVKGDFPAGVALLEAMLLEYGGQPDQAWPIMTQLGELLLHSRNLDKAVRVWRRRLEIPGLTLHQKNRARLDLASLLQREGNYNSAQEILQECVQSSPPDQEKAECLFELSLVYSFQKENDQARSTLEELLALSQDSVAKETRAHAAFALADLYESSHEFEKSEKLLKAILADHPNPKAVRARLGLIK